MSKSTKALKSKTTKKMRDKFRKMEKEQKEERKQFMEDIVQDIVDDVTKSPKNPKKKSNKRKSQKGAKSGKTSSKSTKKVKKASKSTNKKRGRPKLTAAQKKERAEEREKALRVPKITRKTIESFKKDIVDPDSIASYDYYKKKDEQECSQILKLNQATVGQLRELAKVAKIKYYYRLPKAKLVRQLAPYL